MNQLIKICFLTLLLALLAHPAMAIWGTPTNGGVFVDNAEHTCASATTCAITVTSTGAGHLLYGYSKMTNASITISGMAGGSTGGFNTGPTAWYHPAGGGGIAANVCAASDATAGSSDCAFVLSSTAGSTTITFTYSGASGGATVHVLEVSYTNGPIGMDVTPVEADRSAAATTQAGVTQSLLGTNDLLIQTNNRSFTFIDTGYTVLGTTLAYLTNTTNGTAPTWTMTSSSTAAVSGISFTEAINFVPNLDTKWIALNRAGSGTELQCFEPYNVSTGLGSLNLTSQLQTKSCSSIDLAQGSFNYTSAGVLMASQSYLYGDIEYRVKFGGGANSGAWPIVFMFGVPCQPSHPTATDNNCTLQEIDISEILNGTFTSVNQQIHVVGPHNDQCTPTVTDVSTNYHVYKLHWASGSLVWSIDGVTTCTITQAYVPSSAMYIIYRTSVGANGGTVNNGTLPWTSSMTYIKWTSPTGVVNFQDNFAPSAP